MRCKAYTSDSAELPLKSLKSQDIFHNLMSLIRSYFISIVKSSKANDLKYTQSEISKYAALTTIVGERIYGQANAYQCTSQRRMPNSYC